MPCIKTLDFMYLCVCVYIISNDVDYLICLEEVSEIPTNEMAPRPECHTVPKKWLLFHNGGT